MIYELADLLLASLFRSTLLLALGVVAVTIALHLLRIASTELERLGWTISLLMGWLVFTVPIAVPWYERSESATDVRAVEAPIDPAENRVAAALKPGDDNSLPGQTSVRPSARFAFVWTLNWPLIVAGIWLMGMFVLIGYGLFCYGRFVRRLVSDSSSNSFWSAQWQGTLAHAKVCEEIPLLVTDDVGPALCRLPGGYALAVPELLWRELSPPQRQCILAHELAHFQRRDVWKSLVIRLMALPHWFNPLAWYAVRRFDRCGEVACDREAAGGSHVDATEYARALLKIEAGKLAIPVFGPAAGGSGLLYRVRRLLKANLTEDSIMKKSLFLAVGAALVVVGFLRFELVAQEVHEREVTAGKLQNAAKQDLGPTVSTEGYFVVPVTTPLQKHLLNDDSITAYANVNARSFVVSETGLIDTQAFDFTGLRRALRRLAEAQGNGKLWIQVNYGYSPPSEAARGISPLLNEAFEGMSTGRFGGFNDVSVHGEWWNVKDYIWQPLDVVPQSERLTEENVGTEQICVYPVRTSLSRYLTDNADCYIRMDAPPLTEWKAEYLNVIEKAVAEIDPEKRRKARVQVLVPDSESNDFEMPVDDVLAVLRDASFQEIRVGIQKGGEQRTWTYGPESER